MFATGYIAMVSATTFFLLSRILARRLWESGMKTSKEMVVVCALYGTSETRARLDLLAHI